MACIQRIVARQSAPVRKLVMVALPAVLVLLKLRPKLLVMVALVPATGAPEIATVHGVGYSLR